jgi:hypothetical protein
VASLEVIHIDLWAPASMSCTTGLMYYITFVDTFTRFTWIYLKRKSDAPLFQQFKTMVENEFPHKTKVIQSPNSLGRWIQVIYLLSLSKYYSALRHVPLIPITKMA